jgi:hypothetical protein
LYHGPRFDATLAARGFGDNFVHHPLHFERYSYDMQTYLKAKTLPNITAILSEEQLIKFQESTSESNTAVFFDTHDDKGEDYERFESMCLALSETLSCGKARFLSEFGKGAFLFKPLRWKSAEDKMIMKIEGSNPLAMAAFVDNNRLPLVCVRSSYTDKYLKVGTLPVVTILVCFCSLNLCTAGMFL